MYKREEKHEDVDIVSFWSNPEFFCKKVLDNLNFCSEAFTAVLAMA